ncbi:MAG: TraX protein [Oscillospiraceae bacterium]|nr:TraX protein [Oscillospiraceae bacterium]
MPENGGGAMTRIVPERYRVLSGSALKLLAVAAMLIDHTAFVLLGGSPRLLFQIGSWQVRLYTAMRFVGRIAFPIYAFLLVEGFLHTRSRKIYALRLFLFALISEIPWNLAHTGALSYEKQNVFFTLLLGFLGVWTLDRITRDGVKAYRLLALAALIAAAALARADYGISGFGFIVLMYALRDRPLYRAAAGACVLSSSWKAGLAFLPISLYNGRRGFIRGRIAALLFYAVYPIQFYVLYLIRDALIGY